MKVRYLSILVLPFLLLSTGSFAQQLDSLEQRWNEILDDSLRIAQQLDYGWYLYTNNNYQEGHDFAQRLLVDIPLEFKNTVLLREALYQNTAFALAIGDLPLFRTHWEDAFAACSVERDTSYLIRLFNLRAGQYANALRYDSAYLAYQQGLELAVSSQDFVIQYTIRNNLAIIFGEQGLLEKAKANFWAATLGAISVQDSVLVFLGYNNVARCFIESEEPDSALVYLERSKHYMSSQNADVEWSSYYFNSGLLNQLKSDNQTALQHFHRSLRHSQRASDVFNTCQGFAEIGQLHFVLAQYDSALHYLEQAEHLATQLEVNEILRDVLPTMAQSHAKQRNWEEAYTYAEQSLLLRDEYLKEEVQRQVAEMEAKYQLSNYVEENELLKTIAIEREGQVKERTFYAILGFLGLSIISALVFIAWRRNQTIEALNTDLESKVAQRTTDLETANERLQEYLDDLRVFTHVTSHDLKEPLRNISGFASLLRRRLEPKIKDDSVEFMEMIRTNANQMHELIEGIQFYTMLEPEEGEQIFEEVDIEELCRRVKISLDTTIKERGAVVSVEDSLPTVPFSPHALQVILKNLVENAIKYNEDTVPKAVISYEQTAGKHLLHVRDNGIGIGEEYHTQIFQMFKRLHTRQVYSGTGMGLGICRKLARRFGGDIRLQSTVGKGSTFTVVIPVR